MSAAEAEQAGEAGEAALMVGAPEVGIPLVAAQTVVEHAKPIFGGFLIAVSVLFVIIAIIVISAAKTSGAKTAGWLFFALALSGLGFGGYLVAHEKKQKSD